ncbi:MAG: alanine racemase [Luteibaculaceae bacterium]|jgi:alanine racemase
MAHLSFSEISALFGHKTGKMDFFLEHFVVDSRLIIEPKLSCFIALRGANFDGHDFVQAVSELGVPLVVVERYIPELETEQIVVPNSLEALKKLAKHWRMSALSDTEVVGITGSSGKTTAKDWISDVLSQSSDFYACPKSYNSQVGLPISILDSPNKVKIGLFEVGVSLPGEMEKQQMVLQPTLGILMNVGLAHLENFENRRALFAQKIKLFKGGTPWIAEDVIAEEFSDLLFENPPSTLWSIENRKADFFFESLSENKIEVFKNQLSLGKLEFGDFSSHLRQTAFCSIVVLLELGIPLDDIQKRCKFWRPLPMRQEWLEAPNSNIIFNDPYNFDLSNFELSLIHWMNRSSRKKKVLIVSDSGGNGMGVDHLQNALNWVKPDHVLCVGKEWKQKEGYSYFKDTEELLVYLRSRVFFNYSFFIKGARSYGLEEVTRFLAKVQDTVIAVKLSAIEKNFHFFKRKLNPETKVLAMVKAGSYGLGSVEISKTLVHCQVDYLGVAYPEEGVELRKQGISQPILVLNSGDSSFADLAEYNLEPSVFSISMYQNLLVFCQENRVEMGIHLELETGMNRLGLQQSDLDWVVDNFNEDLTPLKGVFSHLAASENANEDLFTFGQFAAFNKGLEKLGNLVQKNTLRHVLNSNGIIRHTKYQFDMVRLGIGLFGIGDPKLEKVINWRSRISQIKQLKKGETIGYGRHGLLDKDSDIAVIPVGYADGFRRKFGNGVGSVLIQGAEAKVVGNVCMDMIMVDVSDIKCHSGDAVEILGDAITITDWAEKLETIPYEILTSLSTRNPKLYEEG